jgi:phage-related protein
MSDPTYPPKHDSREKPLRWLAGEIKTPPFSAAARVEAGFLLRRLQRGEVLSMPHSRPLPEVGRRVHELRVQDEAALWRIVYRIDPDAIVLLEVFSKKAKKTPRAVVLACQRRLKGYDRD